MTSASDARKKVRELRQLEQFKESFSSFPVGTICGSENPDFLVKAEERCIGIEITELHREASEGDTETPRAQLAMKEAVLRQAERLCKERQLELFHVNVNFHPGFKVTGVRQQGLARELA